MSEIQVEIREWLLAQQEWLQEAADRLLKQGELTQTDLNQLCDLLKTSQGQAVTRNRIFESLVNARNADNELRLSGISEVCGIENLSPQQPLNFGCGNLIVVYGHNGSGKSSYTRIFKKASGKPRAVELKPNVFQLPPAKSKCRITYQQGAQETSVDWVANGVPIDAIRAIDIFDSDEAIHYLSNESAASYTPPVVALFESLAATCDQIKKLLQAEQDQLVSALPAMLDAYQTTDVARRYRSLRANLTETDIQKLLTWTDENARELDVLVERLKVDDPAEVAKKKRNTKAQVEQIVATLQQGMLSFGVENLQDIRSLRSVAKEKRLSASEAAHIGSAELDGVGSTTWRALWEAARSYSQTAYPGITFPVTDSARCLLCHQELKSDAQHRLRDFETFVQGKLEAEAKSAEEAYCCRSVYSTANFPS